MEILERLRNLSDPKYKEFSQKILPGAQILGVKMPLLRKLASEILRSKNTDEILEFLNSRVKFHEEFALKALLINSVKISEKERINLARNFIPTIPNWGVCDVFCTKRKAESELWHEFVMKYSDATGEFEKRFFYVSMLVNFVNKKDLAVLLWVVSREISEDYYVQMGAAWALCEYAVKFESEIYEFLQGFENKKIKNLAIKKICESLRFCANSKEKFKKLKI